MGSYQHLLRELTIPRQALAQTANEVGAPVRIEVRLRLVEQEQAVCVAEQQAQA